MIPNDPASEGIQYSRTLRLFYGLNESSSLEEIKAKAIELLSEPKTQKEGIELIIGREVSAEELKGLTDGVFVAIEDPTEYCNQLLAIKRGFVYEHNPELYLRMLYVSHGLEEFPNEEQIKERAMELIYDFRKDDVIELMVGRPISVLATEDGALDHLYNLYTYELTPEQIYRELLGFAFLDKKEREEA